MMTLRLHKLTCVVVQASLLGTCLVVSIASEKCAQKHATDIRQYSNPTTNSLHRVEDDDDDDETALLQMILKTNGHKPLSNVPPPREFYADQMAQSMQKRAVVAQQRQQRAATALAMNSSDCVRNTGRACVLGSCFYDLGPVTCEANYETEVSSLLAGCYCKEGYCVHGLETFPGSTCRLNMGTLDVNVVPVNSESPRFPGPPTPGNALTFSGGGSRSLSLSMGALRALSHLGLLSAVEGLSVVSGGAWAGAIYMFADVPLEDLVGLPSDPSQLTMAKLAETPPLMGKTATTDTLAVMFERLAGNQDLDKLWQSVVAETFLAPFGLNRPDAFMAQDADSVKDILARNPQLTGQPFVFPLADRPKVFVIGSTLMSPPGYNTSRNNTVYVQITPGYTGSPFYPNNSQLAYRNEQTHAELKHITVGGGFVETFAFGNMAPAQQFGGPNTNMASPALPFTLGDAIGMSSAAFAQVFTTLGFETLDPRSLYWPILSNPMPTSQPALNFQFGDGGVADESGVIAMLQRGIDKIMFFMNSQTGLSPDFDFCNWTTALEVYENPRPTKLGIPDQLFDKFGYGQFNFELITIHNWVFPPDRLPPLMCEFSTLLHAGKPGVVRTTLPVRSNSWWGIRGGWSVDLLIVNNMYCQDFVSLLPADTQAEIAKGNEGAFPGTPYFPYVNVILENPPAVTSLTNRQVNLLAAQEEYVVRQSAELIAKFLGVPYAVTNLSAAGVTGVGSLGEKSIACHHTILLRVVAITGVVMFDILDLR